MATSIFDRLESLLKEHHIVFQALRHEPVYTSEEAARVRGTPLASGAKALIVKGEDGFVMFVVPADRKLDSHAVQQAKGWKKIKGYLADGNALAVHPEFSLVVERSQAISPAPSGFSDFVDRKAQLEGRAAGGAMIDVDGKTAKVDSVKDWPKDVIGKNISLRGVVQRDASGWRIERAAWKLLDLADQVGQDVSLEGRLWSCNGHWWFEYPRLSGRAVACPQALPALSTPP